MWLHICLSCRLLMQAANTVDCTAYSQREFAWCETHWFSFIEKSFAVIDVSVFKYFCQCWANYALCLRSKFGLRTSVILFSSHSSFNVLHAVPGNARDTEASHYWVWWIATQGKRSWSRHWWTGMLMAGVLTTGVLTDRYVDGRCVSIIY